MLVYVKNTYKPMRKSKKRVDASRRPSKVKLLPMIESKYSPIAKGVLHRETPHYPSLDTHAGSTAKAETQQYTGDAMLGIGMLHKSNLVPVFKAEDAEAISKMRRG